MQGHSSFKAATKLIVGVASIPPTYTGATSLWGGGEDVPQWMDLGGLVVRQLLLTTEMSAKEIHDPAREHSKSRFRDETGRNRKDREFLTSGGRGKKKALAIGKKHRVAWDTAAFAHMGGLWCDRLLLGEPQHRTAVLHPYTEIAHSGEAVLSALQSHQHIQASDVAVIVADESMQVGAVALKLVGHRDLLMPPVGNQRSMMDEALHSVRGAIDSGRGHTTDMGSFRLPVICVGAAAPFGLAGGIEEEALERLRKDTLPRAAFAAALWCSCPERVDPYLQGRPQTNLQLWRRIQKAMLSVRDEEVLRAKAEGRKLGGLMGKRQEEITMQVIERVQAKSRRDR